jgi:hypothetical protein
VLYRVKEANATRNIVVALSRTDKAYLRGYSASNALK